MIGLFEFRTECFAGDGCAMLVGSMHPVERIEWDSPEQPTYVLLCDGHEHYASSALGRLHSPLETLGRALDGT